MNSENLIKLFERIKRIKDRLKIKDGIGTNWQYSFNDGEIHKYTLKGVKPPEEIEDDISNVFLWLWSLKDYLAKYLGCKEWIELQVNSNKYLSICADLANILKHGELDKKSRSGKNPILGKLKYKIPQAAVKELSIGASSIDIDVSKAHIVVLEMPIFDEKGNVIGDAFEYIDQCLTAWDSILDRANKTL